MLASPAQQRRSYFYLREPLPCREMDPALAADYAETFAADAGAPERAGKLAALKARLAEELPDRLRSYRATWAGETVSGLEAFGEQVLADLWHELDRESRDRIGAPAPTWQESERETLQEGLDWRASGFIGRQAEVERLERLCLDPGSDGRALCLSGEGGAGCGRDSANSRSRPRRSGGWASASTSISTTPSRRGRRGGVCSKRAAACSSI